METLTEAQIRAWIGLRGEARTRLLASVAGELHHRPSLPPDHLVIVKPARWLLEKAGGKGLPIDRQDGLARRFAIPANTKLGYASPGLMPGGDEVFMEIDFLFTWLRGLGATIKMGSTEVLSHLGHSYLHDPPALWYSLASCLGLGRPNALSGEMWELILAWLVAEADLNDLFDALEEAATAVEVDLGEEAGESMAEVAFNSLYTSLRALDAFVPKPVDDPNSPCLTPSGWLAAVEALRTFVATSTEAIR